MRNDTISSPFVFLFDIDGTLLASGGAGKAALEEALLSEFQLDQIRLQVPYAGRTDIAIAHDLLTGHGVPSTKENLHRLHEAYLQRLPEALSRKQGHVLPGVLQLLQALEQMHESVLVGLLTGNIRQGAQVKLGHYEIAHYFGFGGFGDGLLDRNHVAESAWSEAQRHYAGDLAKSRTWVIGDTPLDVMCARAIGVNVLAVATGFHSMEELASAQPDLLLESLADHEDVLNRLVRS